MKRETMTFNGVTYHRYPEAKNKSDQLYFRKGGVYLHREVWKFHNGDIPEGMHVHHKDRNPANNDIENLELISARLHNPMHHSEVTPARKAHLDRVRPMTKKWHASKEGKKWHSEHGKQVYANAQPVEYTCVQCGASYTTKMKGQISRFCSNKCKSTYRYTSGVDNEARTCVVCTTAFICNKYSRVRCCSRKCGGQLRRKA